MTSCTPGRIDVFFRGDGTSIYHRSYSNKSNPPWNPPPSAPPERIAALTVDEPVSVAWGPQTVYLFVLNPDSHLFYKSLNVTTNKWTPQAKNENHRAWAPLGGSWPTKPAVVVDYPNYIHVVLVGHDRAFHYKRYDGKTGKWDTDYANLGGAFLTSPSLTAWDGRFDIFATGVNGNVYHKWFIDHLGSGSTGEWLPNGRNGHFEDLGGPFFDKIKAISSRKNRFDLFGTGKDGVLFTKSWDSKAWSSWVPIRKTIIGVPDVISPRPGRLDVFVIGERRNVFHIYRVDDSGEWLPANRWEKLEGQSAVHNRPTAVSWGAGRIDVFFVGLDSKVYHQAGDDQKGWSKGFECISSSESAFTPVASSS